MVNQQLREDLDVRFTGGRDRLDYRAEEAVPDALPDVKRTDRADLIDVASATVSGRRSVSASTSSTPNDRAIASAATSIARGSSVP